MARPLLPGESVAVQQALVAFETRMAPAPVAAAMYHVGRLMAHWGARRGQDEIDGDSILDDFAEDLAPYSEAHIAEACRRWRRRQKFRPAIAELIELIEGVQITEREHLRRARVLLGLELPRHWEKAQPPAAPAVEMTDAQRKKLLRKINNAGGPLAGAMRALLTRSTDPEGAGS